MAKLVRFFLEIRKIILITVFAGISGGCASIINPDSYNIAVSSGTPGANCTVVTKSTNEVLFSGETPCTVTLSPSRKDCIFRVNGQEKVVRSTFSPWFLGNIIFYYGAPLGMLIDLLSGKVWIYPTSPLYFN